jgi:hypothetical protein
MIGLAWCLCTTPRRLCMWFPRTAPQPESRDSVVDTATRYGLEGPGIEPRWDEIFRTYPDRLRDPPSFLNNGYRVFPGDNGGRGVMLTTHPLLVPGLRKNWVIPPLTLWVLLGLLRGSLYLLLLSRSVPMYYGPRSSLLCVYYDRSLASSKVSCPQSAV